MSGRLAGILTIGALLATVALLQAQSTQVAVGVGPATEVPTGTLPFNPSAFVVRRCVEPNLSGEWLCAPERPQLFYLRQQQLAAAPGNQAGETQGPSNQNPRELKRPDFNQDIYYKNKLEFSLESGWLPINIPFPFDFLLGDGYNFSGLYYTLVPVFASLRWQVDGVRGPWILRGNWDWSFTLSATAIPRGAETRYFSYIMGIRRNFVRPRWRIAPFVDGRLGLGNIDAKGPLGVDSAQGQNFTFTLNIGSGVRYNFNPRFAISGGINWMHISNLYLSQPKFLNYGINVYGPMFGIDVQLRRHRQHSEQ